MIYYDKKMIKATIYTHIYEFSLLLQNISLSHFNYFEQYCYMTLKLTQMEWLIKWNNHQIYSNMNSLQKWITFTK